MSCCPQRSTKSPSVSCGYPHAQVQDLIRATGLPLQVLIRPTLRDLPQARTPPHYIPLVHILSKYAFEIFRRHRDAAGFRLIATDYSPSVAGGSHDIDAQILGAKFCLAPAGTGWGMRVFHVMALGCVPVLVQDDGIHPPVAQAFEPQLLDWSEFSVLVRRDQVAELPALLRAVDLPAKQAALRRVWSRMVWRSTLSSPLREELPGPDAFDSTIAMLLAHATPGSVQRVVAASSSPPRPSN